MSSTNERFKVAEVVTAIEGSGGIISDVARRLGCHPGTVTRYIRTYTTVRRAFETEKERMKDMAEGVIHEAIRGGDVSVSKWYLSMLARERGYVSGSVQEHSGEVGVRVIAIGGVDPKEI